MAKHIVKAKPVDVFTEPEPASLIIPDATAIITVSLVIDASYLKAVGVNADTAATLIAEAIRDLITHEDRGSTISDWVVKAQFVQDGLISELKLES